MSGNSPTVDDIKRDLRLLIRFAFQPSFIEISSIKGFSGDELFALDDSGLIFWHKISPVGAQALRELIVDREIAMLTAHPAVYAETPMDDLPPYPLTLKFGPHDGIRWMPALFQSKRMRGYSGLN